MRRGTYIFIIQKQNMPKAEHQSDTAFCYPNLIKPTLKTMHTKALVSWDVKRQKLMVQPFE